MYNDFKKSFKKNGDDYTSEYFAGRIHKSFGKYSIVSNLIHEKIKKLNMNASVIAEQLQSKTLNDAIFKIFNNYPYTIEAKDTKEKGGNVTNDGTKGGILVGKKHTQGGIKAVVVDTGRKIEVESEEALIADKSANCKTCTHTLDGVEMSNKEILSLLNQDGGGVAIMGGGGDIHNKKSHITDVDAKAVKVTAGQVVITAPAVKSKEKYEFDGKELTPIEILSIINQEKGGVPII
jgi:hypothetical protein